MDRIVIEGGRRLSGSVVMSGAKNAALPMLAATLLSDEPVKLRNIPDLQDIASMKLLLEQLGAVVESDGDSVTVTACNASQYEASYDLVRKMRASVLVLGPMVARLKTGPGFTTRRLRYRGQTHRSALGRVETVGGPKQVSPRLCGCRSRPSERGCHQF